MQKPGVVRIVQWAIALGLLAGTITTWRFNAAGQNVINLTACLMFGVGLDNLLFFYRLFLEKSSFENEGSFVIFCLFMLGLIFENFNRSESTGMAINQLCKYSIVVALIINGIYLVSVLMVLAAFLVRQLYRLMTETLLSPSTNIDGHQLQRFRFQNKHNFGEISQRWPAVNNSCSICLEEFQAQEECVLVPSCQHCFHDECLAEWLNTKSTCPYCRHNIQLDILLEGEVQ